MDLPHAYVLGLSAVALYFDLCTLDGCAVVQVHYSSFQVSFLDFDDEEEEQNMQDEGVASIEDDDGIEGQVQSLRDVAHSTSLV